MNNNYISRSTTTKIPFFLNGKYNCRSSEKCYRSKNSEGEITKTFVFSKKTCANCSKREECTKAKRTGRQVSVGPHEEYLQEAIFFTQAGQLSMAIGDQFSVTIFYTQIC